jgi:FAD synthetase
LPKPKIVLATGAFDLLHYGHLSFLEEAKKAGGRNAKLVVVVASDSVVEKRKKKRPVVPQDQRTALIQALRIVDKAILGFEEMDIERVIKDIKPDILAFGHDQADLKQNVEEIVRLKRLPIKIIQASRFSSEEIDSSSQIKKRILESEKT